MPRKKSQKHQKKYKLGILSAVIFLFVFGLTLAKIFNRRPPCANSMSCINDLFGSYRSGKINTFLNRKISQSNIIADRDEQKPVLGTTTGEKHIYIDLTRQRLTAFERNKLIFNFPVSTGKWYPTPTGDFRIWVKLRFAHMEGGNPADGTYYNLYNIPYTMFYYGNTLSKDRGFSIHGAYWHNNFSYPMSHGCVNMRPSDAGKLFNWADPPTNGPTTYSSSNNLGTRITIFGESVIK